MDKDKTCEHCGDKLVYDSEIESWVCETCGDIPFKKYLSKHWRKFRKTKPYRFFFGPKDFDSITRKASKSLWKGVKGTLLGIGLIVGFFYYYSDSNSLLCCTIWGILIVLLGLVNLLRAPRYFKKLKPPEDPGRSKYYQYSFHYLFPNYLVFLCISVLIFLAIVDVMTLGKIEEGNFLVDFLRTNVGMASFLDKHPYLIPVILWYSATRSMIIAYKESFEAGYKISIWKHDTNILSKQKVDKWYKKLLIYATRGVGYFSIFTTAVYTIISVLIFVLNVYLFHQHRREEFAYGLFSGYNIVIFEIICLVLIFFAMSWVTDYIIGRKYPNTVFGRLGKISMKIRHSEPDETEMEQTKLLDHKDKKGSGQKEGKKSPKRKNSKKREDKSGVKKGKSRKSGKKN